MRNTLATSLFALSLAFGAQAAGAQDAIELHGASQFSDEHAFSSLRLSLSILTTEGEVDEAVVKIIEVVKRLRAES